MSRPSDERLAGALQEAGLFELAARAERGEFNDYFGDHATPKMVLVTLLRSAHAPVPLINAVTRGAYDSGADEAEEWYASPEGQRIRALVRDEVA